jgi:hypothetical protein
MSIIGNMPDLARTIDQAVISTFCDPDRIAELLEVLKRLDEESAVKIALEMRHHTDHNYKMQNVIDHFLSEQQAFPRCDECGNPVINGNCVFRCPPPSLDDTYEGEEPQVAVRP